MGHRRFSKISWIKYAGIAQWQCNRLVSDRLLVRLRLPAPESRLTNSGTALRGVMTPSRVRGIVPVAHTLNN